MTYYLLYLASFLATTVAVSVNTLSSQVNSPSWAGSNINFLIGLSGAQQDEWIDNMASDGAKVVRLWVNGQTAGSCQKGSVIANTIYELENTIGVYNDTVLDAVDGVLVKLATKNMKAIVSPHDAANQFVSGSSDPYWNQYGSRSFYEQQAAFYDYDARLSHVLNYKGKSSGKVWKDWSEVIMAFDLQNEPMSSKASKCDTSTTSEWVCGRAQHMRRVLGANNPIRISSGGVGAIHRYAGNIATNPGEWSRSAAGYVRDARGKLVYIEEWGVGQYQGAADAAVEYPAQASDMNKAGLPWLYWQVVPIKSCDYDPKDDKEDAFSIIIGSKVDVASSMKGATQASGIQDCWPPPTATWRGIKVNQGTWIAGADPNWYYQPSGRAPETPGWRAMNQDNGFVSPNAFSSADIACHKSATAGKKYIEANSGDTLTLYWNTWPESHKGPIINYLAKCNGECTSASPSSLSFTKISQAAYLSGNNPGTWVTDTLIAQNFTSDVKIPSGLAPGNYVLRHEIIALHSGGQANGAQSYPQCLNIKVGGSGSKALPAGTPATSFYKATDPGILFSLYGSFNGYPIPGPAVWSG
ncbi:hypothetical protein NUW58_g5454 [Xylaria curta]|uniref:Uncharacterized protein n=1 Tax=Xylaria curta TaxID=42375 RepID=A0ACC1P1L6_9PEZI|nr:hypothetical protein NUW58_g5454 [Xylaria curta]